MTDYRTTIAVTVTSLDDLTRERVWQRIEKQVDAPVGVAAPTPRRWVPLAAFAAGIAVAAVVAVVITRREPVVAPMPTIVFVQSELVEAQSHVAIPAREAPLAVEPTLTTVPDAAPTQRPRVAPSRVDVASEGSARAPDLEREDVVLEETPADLYARAEAALARKDLDAAQALLERVATGAEPLLADQALYDLARIAIRRGDRIHARTLLDRLLATTQESNLRTAAEQLRARIAD
jgi:hypothetical protein